MNMGSSSFLNQSPSFQRSHHSPICQPMKKKNICIYIFFMRFVLTIANISSEHDGFCLFGWFGSYLFGFSKTVFCVKLFKGKKLEAIR